MTSSSRGTSSRRISTSPSNPRKLKAIEVPSTQSIDIKEFVPLDQVDPLYFDKAYYLGPDKGGAKPYALLSEAMKSTGRAALAADAARGKDYLVLLRPFEDGIVMQQLAVLRRDPRIR